jgi:hypothetical protein
MGRTIYGSQVRYAAPKKACCELGSDFSDRVFIEASTGFIDMLNSIGGVIDAMVQLRAELLFIGSMTGKSAVSPPLMARMMWSGQNKGIKFSRNDPIHILQLKDIYYQMKQDWKTDPFLIKVEADAMLSAAAAVGELNLTPVP